MATIFEKDELKYTQTDIDVRDAKIRKLEKELARVKDELKKYKVHTKIITNSQWGTTLYNAAYDWRDMESNMHYYEN